MEHRQNIINYLQETNEEFTVYLRGNLPKLFPITLEDQTQNPNYFQTDFYLILYRTFLLFGWRLSSKNALLKVHSKNPPFDLVIYILRSLVALKQEYFSTLFMFILCQNIFNYAFKSKIRWSDVSSWLQTQNYISSTQINFIKYRFKITDTYKRNFIYQRFPELDTRLTPKWKKCIINESIASYNDLYEKMENYPEIQVILPVLNWNEGDILTFLQNENYEAFKKISITYKKEMYNFKKGDWWVDFANQHLGGGVMNSGFVQEEILAVKFPELMYFSNEGYKIPYDGAIIMTNLLKSINFPDSWYTGKSISTKSCWDIIAGIEKETNIELKNFIAIAAVDHSRSVQKPFINYTSNELVTVFNRCYSGFMMAKILGATQVNSGPLGTGVFNNSPVFMYTLQILAASAVGMDISFWGTGPNQEIAIQTALKMIADKEVMSLIPSYSPIKGLLNVGASCYMDSVLFSLFYRNNSVISEQILEKSVTGNIYNLQQELIKIKRSIQGSGEVQTCTDFRALLRDIPGGQQFSSHHQQDAGEFLQFLMNLFKVQGAVVRRNVYGTNDIGENPPLTITSSFTDDKASLIDFVDSFMLNEVKAGYMLSNFLIKRSDVYLEEPLRNEGKTFIRKITREQVITVPDFYSFYIQRPDPITNLVLTKPIYPDEIIEFGTKVLQLYSVVIHVGNINSGHYLVYFKYNEKWWIYNDISRKIRKIGNFEEMLRQEPSPSSRGIIYFYGHNL
jgi:hypothetical protein